MSSGNDPVTWRTDAERIEEVEQFQKRNGFDNRSQALDHVVDVGLREQRNPILWRLKDRVIDWVSILGIAAVMVYIAGATTGIFTMTAAAQFSVAMLITAAVLLAGFELARVVTGMNAVGVRLRDVLRRDKA